MSNCRYCAKGVAAGGLTGGGVGAFWSLFKQGDMPRAITSAVIGLGLAYEATRFEDRYLYCQASDCKSVQSEGVAQPEGIFEPMLKDVFVELQIDGVPAYPATKCEVVDV